MATWLRGGIMLATLVGLPAAWLYWGPLPPQAQRVVDRLVLQARASTGWQTPPVSPVWPGVSAASGTPAGTCSAGPGRSSAISASQAPGAASLEALLAELRRLGAAEYELQHWGSSGELFRFQCAMPLGGSDHHTRHFESVSRDPRQSVEQVLREATQWRVARHAALAVR